jgi:hypothetical protein
MKRGLPNFRQIKNCFRHYSTSNQLLQVPTPIYSSSGLTAATKLSLSSARCCSSAWARSSSLWAWSTFLLSSTIFPLLSQCTAHSSIRLTSTASLTSLTATNCTNVTVAGLPPDVSSVNYAFVLMGLLFVPGFLCMIVVSLPSLATSIAPKNKFYSLEPAPPTNTSASGCLVHTFILLMAAIALMYTYTAGSLMQYLQSFVTLGLNWDVRNAAYLNTVMGSGNVIGRLISMPLSIHVPIFFIVAGSVLTLTLGCILIVLVGLGSVPEGVMWAGTIIAGIGWSPVISCAFYWTNQVTGLTVTQSAVITFSSM